MFSLFKIHISKRDNLCSCRAKGSAAGSDLVFWTSFSFNRLSFGAISRPHWWHVAAFKPTCILICSCWISSWTVPQTRAGQYQENPANQSVKRKITHLEREREDIKKMTELWGERWADPVPAGDSGAPVCLRGHPVSSRGRWLCCWWKDFSEVDTAAEADRNNNNTAWQSEASGAEWSSTHWQLFRHHPSRLIFHLPTLFPPQDSLLWMASLQLKLTTL